LLSVSTCSEHKLPAPDMYD